mgnify:FL=1
MKKSTKKGKGDTCESCCGMCKGGYWLFPLLILLIALVPGWLTAAWTQWALVIIAVLLLIKKKFLCSCNK